MINWKTVIITYLALFVFRWVVFLHWVSTSPLAGSTDIQLLITTNAICLIVPVATGFGVLRFLRRGTPTAVDWKAFTLTIFAVSFALFLFFTPIQNQIVQTGEFMDAVKKEMADGNNFISISISYLTSWFIPVVLGVLVAWVLNRRDRSKIDA